MVVWTVEKSASSPSSPPSCHQFQQGLKYTNQWLLKVSCFYFSCVHVLVLFLWALLALSGCQGDSSRLVQVNTAGDRDTSPAPRVPGLVSASIKMVSTQCDFPGAAAAACHASTGPSLDLHKSL